MIKSKQDDYPKDQIKQPSTTIDFPDDVLYEIMTNLDSWYILKYCTLISKQWKRIIKETIRLSLDFKTEFDDQRAELFKQSQFLDRIFSVHFQKRNLHLYQVLILMPNLVRVSFIRINEEVDTIICNLKQVLELVIQDLDISSMNNLTKLDLSNCFFDRGVSNIHTLQKLTSLNIASTNNSIDIEPIGLLTNLTFLNVTILDILVLNC